MTTKLEIREIKKEEFVLLGQLMIDVYSNLDGFPSQEEQPGYYKMLANIGNFTEKKEAKVLVALSVDKELVGGVVYFSRIYKQAIDFLCVFLDLGQ